MPDVTPLDARKRVLSAAETLFGRQGYNAAKMQEIAAAAGIRQASLYYHFPSKEDLFMAVTEQVFARHHQGLQQAIAAAPDLRSQLEAVTRWFLSQPPLNFLSLLHTDMPALSQGSKQHLGSIVFPSIFDPLTDMFARARDRHEIRDVQPETLAGFLLTLMDGINLAGTTIPTTSPKEVLADQMVTIFLDGLGPR